MLGRTPAWSRGPLALLVGIVVAAASAAARAEKRPLPDYDGRPDRTTAREVALWVPRVVFFPLYVVSDFVIRRPLGWTLTVAERELAGDQTQRSAAPTGVGFGVLPTFRFEHGFDPRVGLRLSLSRLFVPAHTLRAHVGFWGLRALSLAALDRVALGDLTLEGRVGWARRPDDAFWGLGPDARDGDRARVRNRRLGGSLAASLALGAPTALSASLALRDVAFSSGTCCGDPAIAERIAAGAYPAPHGLAAPPLVLAQRLELAHDPRAGERPPRAGVHAAAAVAHAADLRDAPDDWLLFGATLGAFVDLTRGRGRVVDLSLAARFVRPLDGEVPFTELVSLGGAELAGFPDGRLLGESALVAALRYRWPVWVWLHGAVAAEVGNVFGRDLDGFAVERLRFSLAMSVGTIGKHAGFKIVVGAATDPFDAGGRFSTVRVAIGTGDAP